MRARARLKTFSEIDISCKSFYGSIKMKIKNINGSSSDRFKNPPQGYYSWIFYYKDKCGYSVSPSCANISHNYIRDNIVGAHVRKAGSSDEKWYIVPLCETCNALNSDVEIDIGNTPMVEVNP